MLITKQLKKSNHNIRYHIQPHQPTLTQKPIGAKLKNTKRIKEKLFKNASNLGHYPIELPSEKKENISIANIMVNRPNSSLVASDHSVSVSKSKDKIDFLPKKKKMTKKVSTKKTTFGIQQHQFKEKVLDTRKRKLSGTSQNPRNNRSVDDELSAIKGRLVENRKRFNLSCGDMIENRSKSTKVKNKKKSQPKVQKSKKDLKGKENKEKSQDKWKGQMRKISQGGFKSKASTVAINKEKQKKKPKKKEKKGKKQNKYFIFSKRQSEREQSRSIDEYPTNKYIKFNKKQLHHESYINYNETLNIFTGSSGVIPSLQSGEKTPNIHEHREPSLKESVDDVDINEIRFYERHSPLKQKTKISRLKKEIENEIEQEFPSLNLEELNFLSSVIFIQRKWREFRLKNQFRKKPNKILQFDTGKETFLKETRLNSIINQPQQTSISYGQLYNPHQSSSEIDLSNIKDEEERISERVESKMIEESFPESRYKNFQKQIFPELNYIEWKKQMLRENLEKQMKSLSNQYNEKLLTIEQMLDKSSLIKENYQASIKQLKKGKRDIKKGYLTYIDCLNQTKKATSDRSNHQAIRKVSSETGFISTLYQRIFKFDRCLSQISDQSDSIQFLNKKMLIRKEFFHNKSNQDLKSQSHSSAEQRSVRLKIQQIDMGLCSKSYQLIKREDNRLEEIQKLAYLLQQQLLLNLTMEFEDQLSSISPYLLKVILGVKNQKSFSQSPKYKNFNEEFQSLNSPTNIVLPLSPVTDKKVLSEPQDILFYLKELLIKIKESDWIPEIVARMNENQSFTPELYLKFLRDFEIPEDDYDPIISNEKFIQWQTYYLQTYEPNKQEIETIRQSKTIFHRCIFEVLLSQLEKRRPYGEKGKPMPWQRSYTYSYQKQIQQKQMATILNKSYEWISSILDYKCGVIIEKYFYCNEGELERIHEENQDRIIDMLEDDLDQSPNIWYETDEHALEINLQLSYMVEQLLFQELLHQLS